MVQTKKAQNVAPEVDAAATAVTEAEVEEGRNLQKEPVYRRALLPEDISPLFVESSSSPRRPWKRPTSASTSMVSPETIVYRTFRASCTCRLFGTGSRRSMQTQPCILLRYVGPNRPAFPPLK